jgi:hypothetical protein
MKRGNTARISNPVLLIEGCFYRYSSSKFSEWKYGGEFVLAIIGNEIEKEPLSTRSSQLYFTAINPIAGELLSSRAHFLFRLMM